MPRCFEGPNENEDHELLDAEGRTEIAELAEVLQAEIMEGKGVMPLSWRQCLWGLYIDCKNRI